MNIGWLLFIWIKNVIFLRKMHIFALGHIYFDTKVKLWTAVTLVLVRIIQFSKNWHHQGVLLFQKTQWKNVGNGPPCPLKTKFLRYRKSPSFFRNLLIHAVIEFFYETETAFSGLPWFPFPLFYQKLFFKKDPISL